MDIAAALGQYGEVKLQEEMKSHTTFRIGGKVQYAFFPKTEEGICAGVAIAKQSGLPYKVVGKGSNLLWTDDDLNMIVIFPDRYCHDASFDEEVVECAAGCSLIGLAMQAMQRGLSGLEFASGIPGCVGGAVFMNAGAYRSSMADIVESILVLRDGEMVWMAKEELQFGYRHSILKDHPDWVVLRVKIRLAKGDMSAIEELMQSRRQRRLDSQPLDMPSAGSTFKNPEGIGAWQCIESLQLRGHQIGGAQISTKHCNFVVNAGNASAKDVLALVSLIQERVYEEMKIRLVMEVEQFACQTNKSQ